MRAVFFIFLLSFFLSCQSNEKSLSNEIGQLQKANDSLIEIINDINNKYVFDSISFREIPDPKNNNRLNSDYGLELLVVGYSKDRDYFIKYDTIINEKMINPDTLRQRNGGFKFNMKLDKKTNPIKIHMDINNEYGKSEKGKLYDAIRVDEK